MDPQTLLSVLGNPSNTPDHTQGMFRALPGMRRPQQPQQQNPLMMLLQLLGGLGGRSPQPTGNPGNIGVRG